jgi:hypothetical protein
MMVAYSVMSTERNPHVILLDFILNPEIWQDDTLSIRFNFLQLIVAYLHSCQLNLFLGFLFLLKKSFNKMLLSGFSFILFFFFFLFFFVGWGGMRDCCLYAVMLTETYFYWIFDHNFKCILHDEQLKTTNCARHCSQFVQCTYIILS